MIPAGLIVIILRRAAGIGMPTTNEKGKKDSGRQGGVRSGKLGLELWESECNDNKTNNEKARKRKKVCKV